MTRILSIAILALALASPAHAVPCFPSVEVARAHGVAGHLAYQLINGPKEWFKGHKGQHVKCDVASPDTVSVLDRPRSRSRLVLDTPKAAGAERISQSPPPVTTGMNVSAPPPPAVTDWKPVPVHTEPAKWPDMSLFAGPDPTTARPVKTGEDRRKAALQKEEPAALALAFIGPASMTLGISLIWLGWRMKP